MNFCVKFTIFALSKLDIMDELNKYNADSAIMNQRLLEIKGLMQTKCFKHFFIPNQFDYDATVDVFFEDEICDEDMNIFTTHVHHGYETRWTIDGIYLEDGELNFDVSSHGYCDGKEELEGEKPQRMSVAELLDEFSSRTWYTTWMLNSVLDFYIDLLKRYDKENAYIE